MEPSTRYLVLWRDGQALLGRSVAAALEQVEQGKCRVFDLEELKEYKGGGQWIAIRKAK